MKYFLSAGEASGDLHASHLINEIRKIDSSARFRFLGGDLMAAEAGVEPIIHYREMAFMGFVDVALNLKKVLSNLATAKEALKLYRPDCLILVDYPSFNLRLAKEAKRLGIKVFYYISPKVWAWKEYRVKEIRELVDNMFCILPFETEFYRRHSMKVEYVGNPSVGEVDAKLAKLPSREQFLKSHKLPNKPIIALLPGSRVGEIKANLPIMAEAIRKFPHHIPIIASTTTIEPSVYETAAPGLLRIPGETFELLAFAQGAMITSGTATLEAALVGVPQVVAYRANGSWLVYNIFRRILKVPYVSLPNLIVGREIISEQLLHNCTPENLARSLQTAINNRTTTETDYAEMRRILTTRNAPLNAAKRIVEILRNR